MENHLKRKAGDVRIVTQNVIRTDETAVSTTILPSPEERKIQALLASIVLQLRELGRALQNAEV